MILIKRSDKHYCLPMLNDSRAKKRDWMQVIEKVSVELLDGQLLDIYPDFWTDFHSSPRWAWSLVSPFDNRTNLAAVAHDWLYENWEQSGIEADHDARHYADFAYLELMDQFSPETPIGNFVRYVWVRSLGWYNWNDYRRKAKKIL